MTRANPPPSDTADDEQAVRIEFDSGDKDWSQFWTLENTLQSIVEGSGFGEYDGNALALDCSCGALFLYGPDADVLLGLIRPYLQVATFMRNVVAFLSYGIEDQDGVRETTVR